LGISETCLVALAFVAATIARLGPTDATLMFGYEKGAIKILLVSGSFMICMYYFDLYDSSILSNRREVFSRLVGVLGTVCVVLAVLYYLYPSLELGRGIFAIGFILVAVLLLLWRTLFSAINSQPQFAERALIFGDGPLAASLLRELESRPELGLRVVGQLKTFENGNGRSGLISGEEKLDALLSTALPYKANHLIVALGERRGNLPVEALLQLKRHGVRIRDGSELYEAVTGKVPIEFIGLSGLLFSPGFRVSQPSVICRRVFSFVVSLLGLVVTLPLMVLIALAVRLDSVGPVIFQQKRVGQDGELFTLYKFRTMMVGSDGNDNPRPAETTDGRFTHVGRWLRRTRMDELPQIVNILRGDMLLVGPRPFVPNQEQECLQQIPFYRQRWVVKPGATGWAQVNRGYCATLKDNEEKFAYDLFYIKNASIGLDLLILFKTVKILLLGRGSR
jgi:sugar transferase (PEP-CTERM system associated)